MSDSFNTSNSIWPNGMKVDEEGYAVFYPLGTNKTNISTITWPEGNKLVSPFVYDKNDKLVGFADTKALEIDNNDTTININYTHFDADLDSIMENTLTINAPENATVNVKYGAVDKVLTEKIEKILGKGNCKVKFDKDTNKAIVAVSLDTTDAQIADVKALLDRVLPQDLVTEMQWANGLPVMDGYMPLEYVDTVKQLLHDSIITTNAPDIEADIMFVKNGNSNEYRNWYLFSSKVGEGYYGNPRLVYTIRGWGNMGITMCNDGKNQTYFPRDGMDIPNRLNGYDVNIPTLKNKRRQYHFHDCGYTVDGKFYQFIPPEVQNGINWGKMGCFGGRGATSGSGFRIYKWTVRQNGAMTADLVPCVRLEDGAPGFWCNVYKKFYDQAPVATTDLNWDEDDDNGVYYLTEEEIAALETKPPVEEEIQ